VRHKMVCGRSGRIHYPKVATGICDDALDANEVVLRGNLVLLGISPGVPILVRIRLDSTVLRHLGYGDGRVFGPAREVHEDATVRCDRDAGDLVLELATV
jgi:hypothetical protein